MDDVFQWLEYVPYVLLLPTLLTSSLFLMLITTSSPKFIKVYSTVLTLYTLLNLLLAVIVAISQPRLWTLRTEHAFSSQLPILGGGSFAMPVHLLHYSSLILLYIILIRFLALKGLHFTNRIAGVTVLGLYFTIPLGLLISLCYMDTEELSYQSGTETVILRRFVPTNFWTFLTSEASLYLPLCLGVLGVFLNFAANALVFSRDISLGYVHRVLICKKMAESIVWHNLLLGLCLSGSTWLSRLFPQLEQLWSRFLPVALAVYFCFSPLHLSFTIRPFHEKLQKMIGRRYSEAACKSISVTFEATETHSTHPPIA